MAEAAGGRPGKVDARDRRGDPVSSAGGLPLAAGAARLPARADGLAVTCAAGAAKAGGLRTLVMAGRKRRRPRPTPWVGCSRSRSRESTSKDRDGAKGVRKRSRRRSLFVERTFAYGGEPVSWASGKTHVALEILWRRPGTKAFVAIRPIRFRGSWSAPSPGS